MDDDESVFHYIWSRKWETFRAAHQHLLDAATDPLVHHADQSRCRAAYFAAEDRLRHKQISEELERRDRATEAMVSATMKQMGWKTCEEQQAEMERFNQQCLFEAKYDHKVRPVF